MITLRDYKIEDWAKIDDAVEPFPIEEYADTVRGIGVTGIENGEVMACGGIVFEDDTNGTIWLKVSKKCLNNRYGWARTIREVFSFMKDSVDLKISTFVLNGFCQGERMARMIGLSKTDEKREHKGKLYYRFA